MVSMTIPNGATVALYNCNGIGLTITVNSGGTMGITGCSGIYINDNGGTINDYGVAIQNNLIKNDSGYVNDSVSAIKVLAGDGNQIDLNTTGTASPVTINSVTLDDESAYHIKARVVAKKQDGSDRALYTFEGLFYRDGGGNATQEGSTTTISTIESAGMSGCACDFAVSGSQVFVQVTGLDATSIDWRTQIEIAKV